MPTTLTFGDEEEAAPAAEALALAEAEETPDGDTPAEEEESEELFPAEEEPEGKKDLSQTGSFQRIIGQRNKARAEVATARDELGKAKPFADAVLEIYQGKADPVASLRWDAKFLETWERLSHEDPQLAQVAQRVQQAMTTGQLPPRETTTQAPARDTRVDQLLEKEARRDIEAQLREAKVNPARIAGLARFVAKNAADPQNVEREELRTLSARYMEEHGFSRAEMIGGAAKPNGTRRPPARGSNAAAAGGAAQDEPAEAKPLPKPDQWAANRSRLKAAAMRSFGQ